MGLPNGIHHLAIATTDVKKQIEFFTEVCGMELRALYWMHGVEDTFHAFLRLNDSSSIAFVQSKRMSDIDPVLGVSHADGIVGDVAPGAIQHIAMNVDSEEELLAMRDRLRSCGHAVVGPLYHGLCKSIYFSGPEGLMLEFSTSEGGSIDPESWIDPEVAELAGISSEELKRYKAPAAFVAAGGSVPQPALEGSCVPYAFPADSPFFALNDEEVTAQLSESTPPVQAEESLRDARPASA